MRASEAHWRSLFEKLNEGFIVGEVIRGSAGEIRDWRYIDVNRAWGELVGIDPGAAVGATIREVFPGIEDEWITVTPKGRLFVRAIAMVFDRYLRQGQTAARYSKVV